MANIAIQDAQSSPNSIDMSIIDPTSTNAPINSNMQLPYTENGQMSSATDTDPFAPQNLQANIQQLLASGASLKDVREFVSLAKEVQALSPQTTQKALSAEAAKSQSNALAGIEAINDFRTGVSSNPSAFRNTLIPARSLFGGAVGNALGTGQIDAASQQIIDVIARLRTGAAISKEEESRFKQFIPLPGDSETVREQKLGYLERQFNRVAQEVAGGGQQDLSTVLAGYGQ